MYKSKGKIIIRGKIWKYGDNVNTDVIFPGKYTYTISDPVEMGKHALEELDPEFPKKVKKGDVIVAGANFGSGSSRDQAPLSIKYAGVGAVIAESFARIFFRNAINVGLPLIIKKEVARIAKTGDEIEIDFGLGKILYKDEVFVFPPFPEKVLEILESGGLIQYTRKRLNIDD